MIQVDGLYADLMHARGYQVINLISSSMVNVARIIFKSRIGCRQSQARASTSRAWGTLSLLGVLLQARIPKRDIVLIATVGCIWVCLSAGSRFLGGNLLLAAVWPCIHFGEIGVVVVVLLIVGAAVPTARAAVLFLLLDH